MVRSALIARARRAPASTRARAAAIARASYQAAHRAQHRIGALERGARLAAAHIALSVRGRVTSNRWRMVTVIGS